MNLRKSLSTFTAAGLVLGAASVAGANDVPSTLEGDMTSRPCVGDSCTDQAVADERPLLEGEVAAIDDSGRLVLRTEEGLIALRLQPDDVQGLRIGQTLQVALIDEESE